MVAALSIGAACTLLAGVDARISAGLWVLTLVAIVAIRFRGFSTARRRRSFLGSFLSVRLALAFGVAGLLLRSDLGFPVVAWTGLGLLLLLIRSEPLVRRAGNYKGLTVANVPGVDVSYEARIPHFIVFVSNTLALVLLFLFGLSDLPGGAWILVSAVGALPSLAVLMDTVDRRRRSSVARAGLRSSLEDYAPKFAVYWDVPNGPAYQLSMWLPYLDQINERFVIILRTGASFPLVTEMTSTVPVILAKSLTELEETVVPSLTTVFYVNNAARNGHYIRHAELTHVQLLHGDSDKAPSYNPVTAMFDKIFVAGQAGIDRYAAHGVHIPADRFEIVGRPQVDRVVQSEEHIGGVEVPHVLYAPTWQGYRGDSNYSSLPHAESLIASLIERGVRVTFRPHPYSYADPASKALLERVKAILAEDSERTGRAHVFGKPAEDERTIVDCFNEADAMLADVSSVIPDFLFSNKPFALVATLPDLDEFVAEFPLASVAYVVDDDLANLNVVLDDLLKRDPIREERIRARAHYLGDFPPDNYANVFVTAARRLLQTT